jgi:hypothetical protein
VQREPGDPITASPVPAEVTAVVGAALRDAAPVGHQVVAPRGAPHTHSDRPIRWRRAAAVTGLVVGVLALGIGVFALARGGTGPAEPKPDLAIGPTAEHITVHRSPARMPLSVLQIHQLLDRPADLGALTDVQHCLGGIGYPAGTRVLGAQPVQFAERSGVLLVLPGPAETEITAVVVTPDCGTAGSGSLIRTVLPRP